MNVWPNLTIRKAAVSFINLGHGTLRWAQRTSRTMAKGRQRGRYNQIANYALAQSEINIAIGDKAPAVYFSELAAQSNGGKRKYGGITDLSKLKQNLAMNCIPECMLNGGALDYDAFLEQHRKLMATKIQTYFQTL